MNPNATMTPVRTSKSPLQWLRKNLFNTTGNTLLTVVCLGLLVWIGGGFYHWLTRVAQWQVVSVNWPLFVVGRYPVGQAWRIWIVLGLLIVSVGAIVSVNLGHASAGRRKLQNWVSRLLPIMALIALYLIFGGPGLKGVATSLWGGLFLTLFAAIVSIALAFPLSILLALGRQSSTAWVRWLSIGYIELVRGLPLIGILFMAQVMLPLVLPTGVRLDRVARAIAGLSLFNAAYLAENVRSGLQAIPRGQIEAARALGLNTPKLLWLVVLPQALRIATPAIVGQFISLFKDTSLLALFAVFELTGIARSVLAQPEFIGRNAEVYLFIGLLYWVVCYGMSQFSRLLETQVQRH